MVPSRHHRTFDFDKEYKVSSYAPFRCVTASFSFCAEGELNLFVPFIAIERSQFLSFFAAALALPSRVFVNAPGRKHFRSTFHEMKLLPA